MDKSTIGFFASFAAGCGLLLIVSCSRKPEMPPLSPADSTRIVQDNINHRVEVDAFFRDDSGSPFHRDSTITYRGIKWYPIDPRYCGQSVLHRYEHPDTVLVRGTKGELRHELRYGYFKFVVPDENGVPTPIRLNVYKFTPYDGQRYLLFKNNLNIWFTDRTTGKETYGVGRYVDLGNELPDESHVYSIDLNKAYNPYCAYSNFYSCPIPAKEDTLPLALRVGEMKYHD